MLAKISQFPGSPRFLHTSRAANLALKQKPLPSTTTQSRSPLQRRREQDVQPEEKKAVAPRTESPARHAKRNEVGVQMLSRELHEQVFRNITFPPPEPSFVRIAREHLDMHGLDPTQGSVLPDTDFTLPPLQGETLDEHFYNIGSVSAQPWLSLAQDFATADLPPRPESWQIESGWTKYIDLPDGSGYFEHVPYPEHDGKPENMLTFDVETLPNESPYAVMACAASKNAWYAWISPWLLGESPDPQHLIPLGKTSKPRVVVGHNVSYDRARVLEEYTVDMTSNRFLDTMALHVAVKGISSHQRPAWMKHRKDKQQAKEQKEEAVDAVLKLIQDTEKQQREEQDTVKKEDLKRLRQEMEDSLPQLQAGDGAEAEAELSSKRWEDITSANSLADVAKLHCDIDMDKTVRNDFMTHSREEICENVHDYLTYCSSDVAVTHAVFSKVLLAFLETCPSPVSFAGILTMGSAVLPVNQEWERYIENAERTYRELEDKVKVRLIELARQAKDLVDTGKWEEDVWLSQLDWTPKVAGKSRGILAPEDSTTSKDATPATRGTSPTLVPSWYKHLLDNPLQPSVLNRTLPFLLKLSFDGHPLAYTTIMGWHYVIDDEPTRLPTAKSKTISVLGGTHGLPAFKSGRMSSCNVKLATAICSGDLSAPHLKALQKLAKDAAKAGVAVAEQDPWLRHLDWRMVEGSDQLVKSLAQKPKKAAQKAPKPEPVHWPKWYWDLTKPKKDQPPGTLDITVRNRISPILLRLAWQGWPLFHSREHGWTFRVARGANFQTRATELKFYDPADDKLQTDSLQGFAFYKLPHKDGEKANVGSPLGKTFMPYAQDGTLTSPGDEAKDALDMNAQCSYWISARDRVQNQMVVWQGKKRLMGLRKPEDPAEKWGVIIPQVITMGTVTRRAIEKTWLTASNAKKNRVGSELKAMVRAPEGYALVGADVDSEELWISSAMGDAQFGLHGATAIGWMTLEGTKAAGTDLHSKTAKILGISRDQAKVFNYSRIYGAGMRHAVLLLLQSNPGMLPEQAQKLAENLYASTKGKNTHRADIFGRKFWFGGTESYVFNKLEEIALSDKPQTPALGCGITYALSKEHLPAEFGSDYMTSRINWVVQSSGVDYLHLLIVSMDHLIKKYNIQARYLISVHDELRYLVKEEDKYRAALALQIANLWTRSLFAVKLGMDDLPQGVAFFSAVDIDKVLRKEVDMPCVTPSHPTPIPPGESLDIEKVLLKTNGGSLRADGLPMTAKENASAAKSDGYRAPDCLTHRAKNAAWLRAQATSEFAEIKMLAQRTTGQKITGGIGGGKRRQKPKRGVGNGQDVDWSDAVDEFLQQPAEYNI